MFCLPCDVTDHNKSQHWPFDQLLKPKFSAKLTNHPVELVQYFDIQLTAIVSFLHLTTMLRYRDLEL